MARKKKILKNYCFSSGDFAFVFMHYFCITLHLHVYFSTNANVALFYLYIGKSLSPVGDKLLFVTVISLYFAIAFWHLVQFWDIVSPFSHLHSYTTYSSLRCNFISASSVAAYEADLHHVHHLLCSAL